MPDETGEKGINIEEQEGVFLNDLSLFSGIAGIEIGLESLGKFRTIGYVENEPYAQAVIIKNMEKGNISPAPIWDEIRTFDGRPWKGIVDVISGGFPCQDISYAGKGKGIKNDTRSGLWFEFKRVVCEVRPKYIFVENVSALTKRGIDIVLAGLSEIGYDAIWFPLQAREVGAPHRRERIFIIGWNTDSINDNTIRKIQGREITNSAGDVSDSTEQRWNEKQHADEKPSEEISETSERESGGTDSIQRNMADTNSERCNGEPVSIQQRKSRQENSEIIGSGQVVANTCGNGSIEESNRGIDKGSMEQDVADSESIRLQRCGTDRKQEPQIHAEEGISECSGSGSREPENMENTECNGRTERSGSSIEKNERSRPEEGERKCNTTEFTCTSIDGIWEEYWTVEPRICRVVDGISFRVDKLKCLGNAVVPQVAREVGKVILWLERMM